jgi:hypothetical protein
MPSAPPVAADVEPCGENDEAASPRVSWAYRVIVKLSAVAGLLSGLWTLMHGEAPMRDVPGVSTAIDDLVSVPVVMVPVAAAAPDAGAPVAERRRDAPRARRDRAR